MEDLYNKMTLSTWEIFQIYHKRRVFVVYIAKRVRTMIFIIELTR